MDSPDESELQKVGDKVFTITYAEIDSSRITDLVSIGLNVHEYRPKMGPIPFWFQDGEDYLLGREVAKRLLENGYQIVFLGITKSPPNSHQTTAVLVKLKS